MKDIFSYNADINKTAYLNWRTKGHDHIRNMIVLADGFMSSAILLTKLVLQDNRDKTADVVIYPILFNANHGIEVYLKAISWSLNNLLHNKGKPFSTHHNLMDLFANVKSLVNQYENNTEKLKTFNSWIEPLEEYLKELYSKIEKVSDQGKRVYNIDFSRYTLDIKNEPQFYITELNNVVVDLENFIVVFQKIHQNLDNFAEHYLELTEWELENNEH
ncbi:hypothetical protein [Metabacillus hrfriensis]|uniref:Uncharacterized protein n=1 Tax=Metabacillus hrfriensis TaxID=3048891 RepID=A0ACD4RI72_9BACI|nr:hypothetical protein [Metabacillus sp. CT-WN-B3]WHZ60087.1 hypothetical protein QLQ22_12460 [Metabacillus sp. CT-WN-B3]